MGLTVEPYLSVVACSRNDDHGDGLIRRMQTFIDGLAGLCALHELPTELILVEWNPPEDRPTLAQVLSFPNDNQFFTTRLILVPQPVHRGIRNSEYLQLFQMLAKNAGIARARGEFVLTTNVDLLFSDELVEFLSSRTLRSGSYYRADRYDVPAEIPRGNVLDELSFCRAHVIRINKREATYDLRTGETYWIYPPGTNEYSPVRLFFLGLLGLGFWFSDYAGRLLPARTRLSTLRSRKKRVRVRPTSGHPLLPRVRQLAPHPFKSLWPAKVLDARLERIILGPRSRRNHLRVSPQRSSLAALRSGFRLAVAGIPRSAELQVRLDTNASGDFILMARQDWNQLRGYPEFQTFSMHLDSLLLYQAYYTGMREAILPYPIYHMAHTAGWGTGAEQSSLVDSLNSAGIQYVTYRRFLELVKLLSRSKDKRINGVNWGLTDKQLPESNPCDELGRQLNPPPEVKGNATI